MISLGYFCSVALELERLGLRSASYPFDWCISDFMGVIEAIENHFVDLLSYDCLSQNKEYLQYYRNNKYNIQFFHDFNQYEPLRRQLKTVDKKYSRRIQRFYKDIKLPTLFVRYISDEKKTYEGKSEELLWIENHYQRIMTLLKSYNENNDILFIGNTGVYSEMFHVYNVEPDENDCVARKPVEKNAALSEFFASLIIPNREENLQIYMAKQKRKNNTFLRLKSKMMYHIKKTMWKEYVHSKQY